ncbi:MAG: hypothetical protein R3C19_25385 [Planctomycetaceae bacterium]
MAAVHPQFLLPNDTLIHNLERAMAAVYWLAEDIRDELTKRHRLKTAAVLRMTAHAPGGSGLNRSQWERFARKPNSPESQKGVELESFKRFCQVICILTKWDLTYGRMCCEKKRPELLATLGSDAVARDDAWWCRLYDNNGAILEWQSLLSDPGLSFSLDRDVTERNFDVDAETSNGSIELPEPIIDASTSELAATDVLSSAEASDGQTTDDGSHAVNRRFAATATRSRLAVGAVVSLSAVIVGAAALLPPRSNESPSKPGTLHADVANAASTSAVTPLAGVNTAFDGTVREADSLLTERSPGWKTAVRNLLASVDRSTLDEAQTARLTGLLATARMKPDIGLAADLDLPTVDNTRAVIVHPSEPWLLVAPSRSAAGDWRINGLTPEFFCRLPVFDTNTGERLNTIEFVDSRGLMEQANPSRNGITCLTCSRDGRWLYLGTEAGSVEAWPFTEILEPEPQAAWKTRVTGSVNQFVLTDDEGGLIVCGPISNDRPDGQELVSINAATGVVQRRQRLEEDIYNMAPAAHGRVVVSVNRLLRLVSAETLEVEWEVTTTSSGGQVAWADGCIAYASVDRSTSVPQPALQIYSESARAVVATAEAPPTGLPALPGQLGFSRDGSLLILADLSTASPKLHVWSTSTWQWLQSVALPPSGGNEALPYSLNADGSVLAASNGEQTLVWRPDMPASSTVLLCDSGIRDFDAAAGTVAALTAFDDRAIVHVLADGERSLFELPPAALEPVLEVSPGAAFLVTTLMENRRDARLLRRPLDGGGAGTTDETSYRDIDALLIDDRGQVLFGENSRVLQWDAGASQSVWGSMDEDTRFVAARSLGDTLVLATNGGTLDFVNQQPPIRRTNQRHLSDSALTDLDISPDGRLIAATDAAGRLHLVDVLTEQQTASTAAHDETAAGMSSVVWLNPELAATSRGQQLRIWQQKDAAARLVLRSDITLSSPVQRLRRGGDNELLLLSQNATAIERLRLVDLLDDGH